MAIYFKDNTYYIGVESMVDLGVATPQKMKYGGFQ